MQIGQLSKATGADIETIRYYERIGLMLRPARAGNGYRIYDPVAVKRLKFILHSRDLGFTIDEIQSLLNLADQPERHCAEANGIASHHLLLVEQKIAQLNQLKEELSRISASCEGGKIGDCKVIDALADYRHCDHRHAGPLRL